MTLFERLMFQRRFSILMNELAWLFYEELQQGKNIPFHESPSALMERFARIGHYLEN